jgi:hypothetical protein
MSDLVDDSNVVNVGNQLHTDAGETNPTKTMKCPYCRRRMTLLLFEEANNTFHVVLVSFALKKLRSAENDLDTTNFYLPF